MKTFPMFIKVAGRSIVIVGGGEQAAQKCRLALKTEADIHVVAERLDPELAALEAAGRISRYSGPVDPAVFAGAALVFVATGCRGADAAAAMLARATGALVNVVDAPDLSDAFTPSIVDRDPVVVAIGTEGTAPVLGRQIRAKIEEMLEPGLGGLATLAGRLRGYAGQRLGPAARRALWRWVFSGAPRAVHARGNERQAATLIKAAIADGGPPDLTVGMVSLVGAGPGSRDLITLRGAQRLQEADVILYDRLADPDLLELARRDAERIAVGKAPGTVSWPQDRINALMVSLALAGRTVVRLKCGDPGIFARGAEEAAALDAAGIPWEIVPGVTAASAAAAVAGGFLTERGTVDTVVLTTGRLKDPADAPGRADTSDWADTPDWQGQLRPGTMMAVYMGVANAGRIERRLLDAGHSEDIDVTIVCAAGTPRQRVVQATLGRLSETIASEKVCSPAMLFIRRPKETVSVATHDAADTSVTMLRPCA